MTEIYMHDSLNGGKDKYISLHMKAKIYMHMNLHITAKIYILESSHGIIDIYTECETHKETFNGNMTLLDMDINR